MNKQLALIALTTSLLSACSGSGTDGSSNPPAPTTPPPDNYDLTVLMIGNSHTNFGNLPGQLQETLQAFYPEQNILVERAVKSLFLSDHLQDSTTLNHLGERNWDYVILQAQKYSVTRTVEYCSGRLNPNTLLSGSITLNKEVFNEKTTTVIQSGI